MAAHRVALVVTMRGRLCTIVEGFRRRVPRAPCREVLEVEESS
jgi:hypothetical protein